MISRLLFSFLHSYTRFELIDLENNNEKEIVEIFFLQKTKQFKVEINQKVVGSAKGKKLSDPNLFPFVCVYGDRNWKLTVTYNDKAEIFCLSVNTVSEAQLPYMAPTSGESDETNILNGTIFFNSKTLLNGTMAWHATTMAKQVSKANVPVPFTDVSFNRVKCSSATMNELLDYAVTESSENLERLYLNKIPGKAQYDPSVLSKFVPKSQSLAKLLIEPEKNEGLEQGTIALSNMAIKIIQMKPPLVELSLHNLGNTEQGVNILDALCSTSAEATTMSLSHLSLTGNP